MTTSDYLTALTDECIAPMLDQLSAETGKSIEAKVRVAAAEGIREFNLITNGSAASAASGEIRAVIRARSKDQLAFSLEGVFPDLSPETGFSGFAARGSIDLVPIKVRIVARSNRY